MQLCTKHKSGISPFAEKVKSNPNNFPIINKWNRRLFNKYRYDIFNDIESMIDIELLLNIDLFLDNLVSIKDFDKPQGEIINATKRK